MKKILLTFVLLVGIAVGLFAQKLTYQAVVRDNNQQLVVNTDVKAFVTITFSTGTPATYKDTVNGRTNIHGLLSIEFGGDALNGRNWEGATIAVKVVNAATPSTVYVNDGARPVSAVPYALSVNGQSIQNYLTEHNYVDLTKLNDTLNAYPTTAVMNARHYLTSDSAVITTMQGDIAALQNASMDCNDVKNCIKGTLSKYTPTTGLCDELSNCQFSGQSLADLLQGLTNQISDLQEQVEYLSSLPHGGGDTPAIFTCGTSKVKDVDNNEYNTVKIGSQCWTKENMKTTKYADSTSIDNSKMFNPGGSEDHVATYGKLYTWSAATRDSSTTYPTSGNKVRGICPAGWHVPSDAEWTDLIGYVNTEANGYRCNGVGNIANALSDATGWQEPGECCAGKNSTTLNKTGFSAVPAGRFDDRMSNIVDFGNCACFWSATKANSSSAWYLSLNGYFSNVEKSSGDKNEGYSVRCLRDAGVGGPAGGNEIAGTTPSAPGGDNACCSELGARLDSLEHVISSQDSTINALNEQVEDLLPFECGKSKLKDAEGNKYNTVAIGNQCWMKENLRTNVGGGVYPKYPNGHTKAGRMVDDSLLYGRLYTWSAMMNSETSSDSVPSGVQGICPTGWHVPSDAEWTALTTYVNTEANGYRCNGVGNIAKALSQPTVWSNTGTGCNAGNTGDKANATGFSAVPAGFCFDGNFNLFGSAAYFWSATQYADENDKAWYQALGSHGPDVISYYVNKDYGYSVRCLRDAGVGGGTTPSAPGGDNACCSELGARLDSLEHVISSQDSTINALNEQVNPFTCGSSKVKDVDNNEYNTVAIGNQCWMKENLRTKIGGDGDKGYPEGADNDTVTYGRLYTWNAMMNGKASSDAVPSGVQGICPIGWHVPSYAEWDTLTYYVYNSTDPNYKCGTSCKPWQAQNNVSCIAKALSSKTGWLTDETACDVGNNPEDNNATGFSAVPAGGFLSGGFEKFGKIAYFWSATQSASGARSLSLAYFGSPVYRSEGDKANGNSVRCLRDAGVGGPAGGNEIAGTTPSAPATMSCEDVMECMGDTLGKLNTKIEAQGQTITTQGHTIDSLAHIVDSLSNLTPGGGDTPTEVADGQPCPDAPTVSDGTNTYNTVKIGNQCWMKENLRTKLGTEGDKGYPTGANNDTVTYGRLYSWSAMMKGAPSTNYPAGNTAADTIVHGICPAGWHVPSKAEFDTLTYYVYNSANPNYKCAGCSSSGWEKSTPCIANALSHPTGWNSSTSEGCNAGNMGDKANATGFAAVPAGNCFGDFRGFGLGASFWSATQYEGNYAWYRGLNCYDSGVSSKYDFKDYGFSVRCLRD